MGYAETLHGARKDENGAGNAAREQTVAQIASENGVHPNQLYRWKALVLEGLPGLFGGGEKAERARQATAEEQTEALYAEIGRLKTQVSWLVKKSGLKSEPR